MRSLSSIVLFLGLTFNLLGQSPHGADFKINCAACHSSASWEIEIDTLLFDHDTTAFPLTGQHTLVDCRSCHQTLVFPEASTECISCHTDMHRSTVGSDCARCHTTQNWLIDNITEIHQDNGFPLVGVHASVSCKDCHTSESELEFNRIGNDCINCHLDEFNATTNPNHMDAGFSTNCIECHQIDGEDWSSESINHDFFPLTKGHDIADCAQCHTSGSFSDTPTDCIACHQMDFENTTNPNHQGADFPTNCTECHTTDPGWMPASFAEHDALFPIYSGEHEGEWMQCTDCHNNPNDFTEFTCINCHTNPETDEEHEEVAGYAYENSACLACHPMGNADNSFDHNDTDFPLTGAHIGVDCILCHEAGYEGTPTDCASCHTMDFEQTVNPNHNELGLPTDCASCHTTDPEWNPASFDIHDEYYELNGAHAAIANDCAACHNGNYNNTPNTCFGCHEDDFNQTTNPDHAAAQFPTDCASCHSETDWVPSTFNHDEHFPLTGAHDVIADDCVACHEDGYDNTPNTCVGCHQQDHTQSVNPNHTALGIPTDCESCHTTEPDWMPATFDIHDEYYMLNGAHAAIANDCAACHNGDYNNTPNTCFGCHSEDYNNTTNPDHATAQFSTDCATCHTESEWVPTTFDHDAQYFPIYSGEHDGEWSDCIDCHTNPSNFAEFSCTNCHMNPETDEEHEGVGGYVYENTACLACHPAGDADNVFDHNMTNFPLTGAHTTTECLDCHTAGYEGTPTDCASCHTMDFEQTVNPNHQTLGLPTDCASCHTTDPGWSPASFEIHDDYYMLNGAHTAIANDCASCHNGDYNNTPNTCFGCHSDDYNLTTNPSHDDAQFPIDCETCHTESAWVPSTFDHDEHFPLTGAHDVIADDCVACHNGDYQNTPNTCVGCHLQDHTQSVNPNHTALGIPTDCESCHTTEPDWMPATFDIHDEYYMLNGAHAAIANDCAACHNGDYNNTPNTCFGCHSEDYNNTTNPDHATAQFSTDCATCHTESEWVPTTFDHDAQYFPIYSGEHDGEWSDCIDCHTNPSNFAEFSCTNCHMNPETDEEHEGVGGYVYENTACLACHPAGDADNVFDHNMTNFPLTGAHTTTECLDCHTAGYEGTPTDCASCHTMDFEQTVNPNHQTLGLPTDCASCHTTDPGWSPASFEIHDDYYMLNGAHTAIANDCASCHNGDYNNTPNTCFGCHSDDYNLTTNPSHDDAQFPIDCETCHTESAWVPSTFDHDEHFPLTGAHDVIADDCVACHNGDYQNTPNTCVGCHQQDHTQSVNPNHTALGIPTDCESCHTTEPDWMPATFDIHDEYYMLNGAHAAIANDCAACHNGDYNNTPNTCFGCHSEDYNNTTNPDHATAQFSTDCATCHTESEWVPTTFDHDAQYFPIYSGEHDGEWSDCIDCHTNPSNFAEFSCTNCHMNPETDEEHEGVGGYVYENTACLACHPAGDADNVFDHNMTNFPLTGAHTTTECLDCHTAGYEGTPTDCASCHTMDFEQTVNPNHQTLGLPTDCASCHTTDPGWSPASFEIHDDFYVLNGAHAAIAHDCASCHNGDYQNTPNTCFGCHAEDFNQTADPDHQAAQFPIDCESCHSETAWVPSTFNHDAFYPLTGAHEVVADDCVACHQGDYDNTPNTCVGCHEQDHSQSVNPNHTALGIPTDCESCHTTDPGWSPASFDIHSDYYVLNGAHAAIANDCASCHNGDYQNTPNTCFGCHTEDYDQTMNPDHQAAQFPIDCESCHTETAWVPSTFNHDAFYPLNGAHEVVADDCVACHEGDYDNTPNTCVGCHEQDHSQSVNPNHAALGIPTDCESCHTTAPGWSPASFDIHNDYYVLNGAHAAIANDCASCHNGDYNNTPNTCYGCHTTDYNQTTNPNHQAAQFPIDCESCHTETAWVPSSFDHDAFYPLTGAHNAIANDCVACHEGDYQNTPNTCVGCHQQDHSQSVNPNHTALGIPTDCESCHTTEPGWSPANFDIHNDYYVLNGAHAAIANDCASCHNGDYNNTPNTCFGCHTADYNQTTNPNHQAAQFPIDCESCHTETAWVPSSFDHDAFYPLTGAHNLIANDCVACHQGDYQNTPNTCVGCHSQDYSQSVNPNHTALGIPTDCENCHTPDPGWMPASFDIHNNYYQLNGAHAVIANDCVSCHNGDYNNTPNTCFGCHTADYNQTTNPNHAAAQFPVDCESCHTETAWVPSSFDHDLFYPLNGAHAIIENDCAACHNGDFNNTPNTCFGCHSEDYNLTTNPNHAAAQFPTDCQSCHTETTWIPSTFDHAAFYPFTGAHVAIANDCEACHNGNYTNTPNTCAGCHTTDYNQSVNPSHLSLGLPMDCESCHTTNPDWMPASFDIHNNYYPLNGAHAAIANDCVVCHNGDYNNTPNTCFGCHANDYNQANNPNHQSAGFPTTCENCHSENSWVPANFDHDGMYFPIYSGKHDGEWNACVDCHMTPGNFAVFNCLECHEHDDPIETAEIHEDVGGYTYMSNACFACHPNGED